MKFGVKYFPPQVNWIRKNLKKRKEKGKRDCWTPCKSSI